MLSNFRLNGYTSSKKHISVFEVLAIKGLKMCPVKSVKVVRFKSTCVDVLKTHISS